MSRASGPLTSRSSNNASRHGTIHTENPDLINSLLEDGKSSNDRKAQKSHRKTLRHQSEGSSEAQPPAAPAPAPVPAPAPDKSVTFDPNANKGKSPTVDTKEEKEEEAETGNELDLGVKETNGINVEERTESAGGGRENESVKEEEEKTQPNSTERADSENIAQVEENPVTKSAKTGGGEIEEPVVKESGIDTVSDRPDDGDKTPVPQEAQTTPGGEDKQRFVSVNWDSEVFDDKAPQGVGTTKDHPAVEVDLDRGTLKSGAASTSSELEGLHSPSRKSLNLDLSEEASGSADGRNDGDATPTTGGVTEAETEKAPKVEQKSGPGPKYSAVSPRASRLSFHPNNAGEAAAATSSSLRLEDAQHPRFTTPYSSQRLKTQGAAAKRSTSVSTLAKDSLDSYRVPVEEEDETKFTVDSLDLDIEKDSLEVDTSRNDEISLHKGDKPVKDSVKVGSEEKVNDFSEDSLNNSKNETAPHNDSTQANDKNDASVVEPKFQTHRSDTEDVLKKERFSVVSVSNKEKELSGPEILDTENREEEEEEKEEGEEVEEKDIVQPVEFIIKNDPNKPGISRYSSASGSGRNSDHYFREKRAPPAAPSVASVYSSRRRSSRTTPSTRKLYIESPTFTKAEEGEYRYVQSRLDNLDDSGRFDTYRELDMAAIHSQGGFDGMPAGKMPEKRVRYSGVDSQHSENNNSKELRGGGGGGGGRQGEQGFVNKNVGFGSQGYEDSHGRIVRNTAAYDNNFSTDESDKENARRPTYGQGGQRARQHYEAADSQQYSKRNHTPPSPRQQRQQQQQRQGPPRPDEDSAFYSKLYSQQQDHSASANDQPPFQDSQRGGDPRSEMRYQPHHQQPAPPPPQVGQDSSDNDYELMGHQAMNPAMPISLPPRPQLLQYSQSHNQKSNQGPAQVFSHDSPPSPAPQQQQQPYHHHQHQQQQQQKQDYKPPVKGLSLPTGPSYDPVDEEDLVRETEYQKGLRSRLDSSTRQAVETVVPQLPLNQGRVQYHGHDSHYHEDPLPQNQGGRLQGHGMHGQSHSQGHHFIDQTYNSPKHMPIRYENTRDFRRDSLNEHDDADQLTDDGDGYDGQPVPDSERYQDHGEDDYSNYENVRAQRTNPQVQPRFYDPQYDQGQFQGQPVNTDRSDMDTSTSRVRYDDQGDYAYQRHGEYKQQQQQQHLQRQDGEGEYVEYEDGVMDAVRPQPPKYDYVEHNKDDYGKQPQKSYQRIHEINKEEKGKLTDFFIHPKPKAKGGILKKRGSSQQSLASQASHGSDTARKQEGGDGLEEGPPLRADEEGTQLSEAEQVWARRASTLANQRQDGKKGGKKGPGSRLQKYNSDSNINQIANPAARNQGYRQIRQAHQEYNHHPSQVSPQPPQRQQQPPPPRQKQQQQHYQDQQPADGKVPRDRRAFLTDLPTPVQDHSYDQNQEALVSPSHEVQLQPITQQIVTEDGQRISVDVNLKLISPPPPHHHPHQQQQQQQHHQQHQQHQHQHVPLRPSQQQYQAQPTLQQQQQQHHHHHHLQQPQYYESSRQYPAEPAQYELGEDVDVSYTNGYSGGHRHIELDSYPTPRERYSADEALRTLYDTRTEVNPFGRIPPIPPSREGHPSSAPVHDQGGSYMDMYAKQRRQEEKPWYKVYDLHDFRKMKKEVHLGTLGPDLDSDILRERKEKVHRQSEYAKQVKEKNRHDLGARKPPSFPRPKENNDIMNRRKVAVEYARNVPKPAVKPTPTEFNNYELASEKSPIAKSHKKVSSIRNSPTKNLNSSPSPNVPKKDTNVEMVNLDKMRQRYEEDKQNEAIIRRNTGSAGGMHGYYTETA